MSSEAVEILRATERASSLTRQLLAFSRKQMLQPCILDLNETVREMEKMLRRLIGEDIELTSHLAPDLWRVKADRGQLEQVLANLSVNARDAMDHGGRLTVKTANVTVDRTSSHRHLAVPPGDYVLLAVSDTGCGMDSETQSHIFEPFFTTKEAGKGTGLGLSMVYGIVKQSGGTVAATSKVGKGTTFRIYLPRTSEQPPLSNAARPEASDAGTSTPRKRNETILLVEDEDAVLELIARILKTGGYQVLTASSGIPALELCRQYEGPIDLLITDVVMPQMSGQELSALVASLRPATRILFISGYTENVILSQGLLPPGTAFLQKPFTRATLADKVREALMARILPRQQLGREVVL
jgi:CheY-like chemotaxis protein